MDNYNGQNPMGGNQNPQQSVDQMQYQQPMQGQYQQPAQQMQYQQPMQGQYQQQTQQMQYQQQTQQMQYQQPMQGQYQQQAQQMQYQQPMQGQYQQQAYQNGYYTQPNYASQKPKSGGLKWLLIIGIPAFLGIAILAIVLFIGFLFPSYDIDDYDDVYDACYDVLGVKLYREDDLSEYFKEEGIVSFANGTKDASKYEAVVVWYEFANDDIAKKYYNEQVDNLKEEYEDEKSDYASNSWQTSGKYTEATFSEDGETEKGIIIREDEYVMIIAIDGKKSTVDDIIDDLLDELD